jgi:hypothetical protein
MRKAKPSLLVAGSVAMALICIPGAKSQALPDLIIDTTLQFDVLRGGVKIEPIPSGNQLYQNRSYLMAVAVRNIGATTQAPFNVRTECVRGGTRVTLGEGRIAETRGSAFALYVIFPSSAGAGMCLVRTTVDADNEIRESSEGLSHYRGQPVAQVHTINAQVMP